MVCGATRSPPSPDAKTKPHNRRARSAEKARQCRVCRRAPAFIIISQRAPGKYLRCVERQNAHPPHFPQFPIPPISAPRKFPQLTTPPRKAIYFLLSIGRNNRATERPDNRHPRATGTAGPIPYSPRQRETFNPHRGARRISPLAGNKSRGPRQNRLRSRRVVL